VINAEIVLSGNKLDASRWSGHQLDRAVAAFEMLMDMAAQDAFHLGMVIDDTEEFGGIIQADAVYPLAADRHRLMVQTDQGMWSGLVGERLFQVSQLGFAQITPGFIGDGGIEEDQKPVVEVDTRNTVDIVLVEQHPHLAGQIMITRQAVGGATQLRQAGTQPFVTRVGGIVHQIAGRQHQIGIAQFLLGLREHLIKGAQGIQSKQALRWIGIQMTVCYLQHPDAASWQISEGAGGLGEAIACKTVHDSLVFAAGEE
jgi:hypothetical protein